MLVDQYVVPSGRVGHRSATSSCVVAHGMHQQFGVLVIDCVVLNGREKHGLVSSDQVAAHW
jgi:hypothetical protein